MTLLGMVGDFDDHMINFRPLGAVEAYNSYNGVVRDGVREGGTFCVLSRVASQLKIIMHTNEKLKFQKNRFSVHSKLRLYPTSILMKSYFEP